MSPRWGFPSLLRNSPELTTVDMEIRVLNFYGSIYLKIYNQALVEDVIRSLVPNGVNCVLYSNAISPDGT